MKDHLEASATYYFEENDPFGKPYGAAAQLWAVNKAGERFKFGIGTGAFFDLLESWHDASLAVSALCAFQAGNHWQVHISYTRIHPNARSDEDIRTMGLGYLF